MRVVRDIIKVYDMTCTSCEKGVERALLKVKGVFNAKANYEKQNVMVEYDEEVCGRPNISKAIKNAGYSTEDSGKLIKISGVLIIVAAVVLLGTSTSGIDMNAKLTGASYFVLFLVGLLTSIHCVGMCGGIMLTQSLTIKKTENKFQALMPSLQYNLGRMVSYTIIGGIIGAIGSVFSMSIQLKAAIQIFAGIFMVIMGLNMTGIGLFRSIHIKLPWSSCDAKKKARTPFLVGIFNGLMPCGPLQTMQLYALGTGSFGKGALSMLIFSAGTVPLMLTFGFISSILSSGYTKKLLKFSGVLVIVLGLIMGNRGLALSGINIKNALASENKANSVAASSFKPEIKDGVQIIRMTANNSGYTPNVLYVQKNMPAKLIVTGEKINSCNNGIVIPSLNLEKKLSSGDNVIEFTPKDKDINFSCWMGMINGVIRVVDDIKNVDTSKESSTIPPSNGMSCCSPQ